MVTSKDILGVLAIVLSQLILIFNQADLIGVELDDKSPPEKSQWAHPKVHSEMGEKEMLEDCLRYSDKMVRRRAILEMSYANMDPTQIVDAIVSDTKTIGCMRAIEILGQKALPRLYYHLANGDNYTRQVAMRAIPIAGQPDKSALASLQELSKDHPDNKIFHICVELIRGPSPEDAETQIKAFKSLSIPSEELPMSSLDWLLVAQKKTRSWIIDNDTRRLLQILNALQHDESDLPNWYDEVILLAYAARTQPLGPKESDCLKRLQLELLKHNDGRDAINPVVVMTKWIVDGKRKSALLDNALQLFAMDEEECNVRERARLRVTFGDVILSADDIPVLITRAIDKNANEKIRIEAIRLLACLGLKDQRVHKVFIDLLQSEQESIRINTAAFLPLLVEDKEEKGSLLKAAKGHLTEEKSESVKKELANAIDRLEVCP